MPLNENERTEFKESFNHEDFEAEVVSFLNEEGGTIYLGVTNKGVGKGIADIDKTMLAISDSLLDRICPDCSELASIHETEVDGAKAIRIDIQKGFRLYHIKKYGHSPKGCYRRFGSRRKSMTQDEIDRRYRASVPAETIMEKKSPKSNLTFSVLKIYLNSAKVEFNEASFGEDFSLRREDGAYNYMAYLLSDQFDESIKVARFRGTGDLGDLVMRKEFGKGCIFKVFYDLLDHMNSVEHRVKTYFDKGLRRDEYLYDEGAFVEAWKNAVLHNSYHTNQFPQVYLFDDHLEVMSHGNPLLRMTKEEFLRGKSKPLSPTLMKLAINVDLTDQTGKGNKDIVKAYGPNVFEFSDNFLTVKIPYNPLVKECLSPIVDRVNAPINVPVKSSSLGQIEQAVLKTLRDSPRLVREDIAVLLGKSAKTVSRALSSLRRQGLIVRSGSDKAGYWKIISMKTTMKNKGETINSPKNVPLNVPVNVPVNSPSESQIERAILKTLDNYPRLTRKGLAALLGKTAKTISRALSSLKKQGLIERIGSDKNGYWRIVPSDSDDGNE